MSAKGTELARPVDYPPTVATAPQFEVLDDFLDTLSSLELAPGFVVMVVEDTVVRYARGFGYANITTRAPISPQSVFYIASITKVFTGLVASMLGAEGSLNLDAPVSRYIRFPLRSPLSADSISTRMLLTHTHGIGDAGPIGFLTSYLGGSAEDRIIALTAQHGPARSGRAYAYSNLGYNLAGRVIDTVAGIRWKALIDARIFKPLGMRSTTGWLSQADRSRLVAPHTVSPSGFRILPYLKSDSSMHAAGGHVSTGEDLARWLIASMNDGRSRGVQALPEVAVRESQRIQTSMSDSARWYQPFGYGLGWEIGRLKSDTLLLATGGFPGFASHLSFSPTRKVGVVVLVNESTYGVTLMDAAVRAAYASVLGRTTELRAMTDSVRPLRAVMVRRRAALKIRADRIEGPVRRLSLSATAYAGSFDNRTFGTINVSEAEGRLTIRMGPMESAAEVRTEGADTIRVELVPAQGENILFYTQGERVDSLRYIGTVFHRVPKRPSGSSTSRVERQLRTTGWSRVSAVGSANRPSWSLADDIDLHLHVKPALGGSAGITNAEASVRAARDPERLSLPYAILAVIAQRRGAYSTSCG